MSLEMKKIRKKVLEMRDFLCIFAVKLSKRPLLRKTSGGALV